MKLGKAKYGNEKTKRNYYKLKDGESVYRILPPMGELADSGRWSMFWNLHYGYRTSEGQMRPFQSPLVKNRKTKMIDVPDPALDRINALKAQLEQAKKDGKKDLVERLDVLVGQKGMYNLDSNHHLNVLDQHGNIGQLKIRHRAMMALEIEIKRLRDKGVDPLSVENGRFFVFRRSGSGLDTTFNVSVLQEKLNIEGVGEVNRDIVHILSEDILSRLSSEASDLTKVAPRPSAEEVERMVKATDILTGKSSVADEIFGKKPAAAEDPETDDMSEYQAPAKPAPVQAAQAVKAEVAKAQVLVKPVQAAVKAAEAPAPTPVAEMSNDEFLKSLGVLGV